MKKTTWAWLAVPMLALAASGCSTTLGSETVPKARFNYSVAVSKSWDEQMLLNLVRLRYRDTTQFLQVSSVLTQYVYQGSAGVSGAADLGPGGNSVGGAAGLAYEERPTVTYIPLEGDEFAKRFLTPISPTTLLLLSQTGWSIERLLLCCVQRFNELWNAPSASGPTPSYVPRYAEFQEMSRILRELQVEGSIAAAEWREDSGEGVEVRVPLRSRDGSGRVERLRHLLDLPPETIEFRLTGSAYHRGLEELAVIGRSLSGILYFLSQGVEPPTEHETLGLVTVTQNDDGSRFDWTDVTGPLIRVQSSAERPDYPFVSVFYRDHWFYIDDRDLNSKTTFSLLQYLFSLQASPNRVSPLLTVSAGN